ncbi:efflux transporter outer membrane subunit [Nguyenibacter vanlangensis]|uniref:Efflux transporter outer membrane subunit n=1 Tax=Nguyenibacter vanlangensis TaxID=1216886 RepID=A0ABZ3D067_9PROT
MKKARHSWYLPALLLASCTLAACSAHDEILPSGSAVIPSSSWRPGPNGQALTASVPEQWWNRFGDPVLTSLVARAVHNNPDMAIAAERVMEARAQMRLSFSAELPHVEGSGIGIGNGRFSTMEFSQYILGGGLKFDTDLFGRLREQTRAAKARMLASAADRDAVELALIGDTVRAYVALQSSREALTILEHTRDVREAERIRIAHEVTAGYEKRSSADQADALVSNAQAQIAATKLQIARQEDALAVLLGDMPNDIDSIATDGPQLDNIRFPPVIEPVPARVLANRPDLVEAGDTIIAADHSLQSARAAFLPDIVINPGIGTIGGSNPFTGTAWALGGSILAPIFEGGELQANERIARSRRNQAAWAYRKAAIEAFREVEDALAGLTHLAEEEEQVQRALYDRQHTLADARKELRTGYVNYFDVANSEYDILETTLQRVQIRAARLGEIATLYQATGGK